MNKKKLLYFALILMAIGFAAMSTTLYINNTAIIKNLKGVKDIGKINGVVEFKNVHFAYDKDVEVLSNVSFKVNKGEKIALVGATGAGKSTIVSLISRFYDPWLVILLIG